MTNQSPALPSRRQAKIDTSLCRKCFCAVPDDRLDAHTKWHADRKKMQS